MGKSTTESYVVSYELKFDEANPMSVLSKLDKIAVDIYNTVLREGLKRLHKSDGVETHVSLDRGRKHL